MMNRKEKLAIRQHQSTRQLMGIQRLTPHGVTTAHGELVFFLIRPDNLTVLSEDGIRVRVTALANLLRAESAVELLALDSRESFQRNKEFYQVRLEQETIPALRTLLEQDIRHLEAIQSASASSREFLLVMRLEEKEAADERGLRQLEKALCDHGVRVQLAEAQDVKRLLAVYYQHDVTTDYFEDVDGEMAVTGNG
ncbi:hypothetical protein PND79_02595 [Flavonifractor plautii]|jgi:hypothetical protein|uniref:hypothetical protein n=1 Tax=Flavonifractor plautii TaxID=292800 RepID=UPI001FAE374A|nr:hypothetical protein [Flavonifractor plautii]MDB7910285.1 hypothetical protein [Flavonifractor plautii]MDB7913836.1 hypothetical protein [Flavonifractor plautii]